MSYEHHQTLIDRLAEVPSQIHWVDRDRFIAENTIGASPGEYLNRYGFEVIGTTIGGNAITKSTDDVRIFFADHSWYVDRHISYQDLAGDGKWKSIAWSQENFLRTIFELASDGDDFEAKLLCGEIDRILDEIE